MEYRDEQNQQSAVDSERKGYRGPVTDVSAGNIGAMALGASPRPFNPDDIFEYHAPTFDQLPKYHAIREAAKYFASVIRTNTPFCADQAAAIRKLREAVMTANAAIALNGRS